MASRREQAGLPVGVELRGVTLRAMRKIRLPASNDDINEAVADELNLTTAQRNFLHGNSSKTELSFRVAWARTVLKVAGAAENVGTGVWTLSEEGRTIAPETVNQRYEAHRAQRKAQRKREEGERTEPSDDSDDDGAGFDWRAQLLERMTKMSPGSFEHLAATLLRAAGFDDVQVTGRSGDGGIDGIGIYRPSGLISFHTAFQCKRYQGSVGPSTVRDFRGSFIGRADRGIIVTTGTFSRDAQAEAGRSGANLIDLVDGEALCELLREYSIGVRTIERKVEDIVVDQAYFDQFEAST